MDALRRGGLQGLAAGGRLTTMARRGFGDLYRSPRSIRAEIDEELQLHLEQRIAALVRHGINPADAREEALRRFGDLEQTRDYCYASERRRERRMQRTEYIQQTLQDLAHRLRQWRRRPAFAAVAVLTLAVGIGATTAIFSAADHVLLRPLPYTEADRVVTLWETERLTGVRKEVAAGNFLEWRERATSIEVMGLAEPYGMAISGDGHPVELPTWLVSEGFFDALGVRTHIGRLFLPEEYLPNAAAVILLSHRCGAVLDAGACREWCAAGSAGGVDLTDAVDAFVGHYPDERPSCREVRFDCGYFHFSSP